jgi:hypothetical protein
LIRTPVRDRCPVTLFGAAGMYESGWNRLGPTFEEVASWFSDVTDFRYDVVTAEVVGHGDNPPAWEGARE